jgi:hypothetical protein
MPALTLWRIFSASEFPPGTINDSSLNDIFERLSPTPRLCIDFQLDSEELAEYEEGIAKAISEVTSAQLEKLFKDARSLSMDAVSHTICLISRGMRENMHSRAVVAPITPSIQSRLANRFRNLQRDEQVRLYEYFARVPESRGAAGIFFEAIAQRDLQERIVLRLIPMVKLDKVGKGKLPQWYSSHAFLNNLTLEQSRQKALQQDISIDTEPSRTDEFPDNGPLFIASNVFYVPEATNHEALDSFILLDGRLIIFQFTVGKTHGIKPGLLRFFEKCKGAPPMSKWRFVFIIEPNLTLISPQPWRLDLRKLHPYSAVVDVSKKP